MSIEEEYNQYLQEWWNDLNDWWKTTFKQYIYRSYRNEAQQRSNNLSMYDIEKITQLESINLWGEVGSLEPLRALTELKKFVCMDDDLEIVSLEPVQNLIKLETINIVGTKIDSLEPLRNIANLKELYCFNTKIKSIKPIMHLNKIELLWIGNQAPTYEMQEFKNNHPNCKINPKLN